MSEDKTKTRIIIGSTLAFLIVAGAAVFYLYQNGIHLGVATLLAVGFGAYVSSTVSHVSGTMLGYGNPHTWGMPKKS